MNFTQTIVVQSSLELRCIKEAVAEYKTQSDVVISKISPIDVGCPGCRKVTLDSEEQGALYYVGFMVGIKMYVLDGFQRYVKLMAG